MGLRIRLLLLVVFAVLPALVIQIATQVDLRRGRESELHDDALVEADAFNKRMLEILDGSHQLLFSLSRLPAVEALDADACNDMLRAMLVELPSYTVVGVIDHGGRLVCNAAEASGPSSLGVGTYFRDALLTNDFVIGEFTVDPASGASILPVAHPIRRANETVGVLFAGLDLQWLQSHLKRQSMPERSVVIVVDRGGTILASEPEEDGRRPGHQLPEQQRRFIFGDRPQSADLVDLDGIERIFTYIPLNVPPPGVAVAIGLDKRAALAPIDRAMSRGLALILAGLALGCILAWLIGQHFVQRPLAALLDATRRWRVGEYEARAGLKDSTSEIGRLGQAFDEMAERLQLQMQQKDLLLREVNHRTMNSLQLLSSVLALQRRRIKDPAARDQFEQARRRIQSLALVHRRLYRRDVKGTIDIGRFLEELCHEVISTLSSAEHPVPLEYITDNPEVGTDKVIPLALIAYELLTNALKYATPRDGKRWLQISVLKREGGLVLAVRDNGPGLPPDVEQRSGLGMKLVQTLCLQLQGAVQTSSTEEGTCIRIIIPGPVPAGPPAAKEANA